MNDLISVIIPVYKVEKYLDRCIESVVNQTYVNLEIILVDDGSPDRCPEICDEWVQKDHRISVIHKENNGLGMARNSGIEAATGSYLMFVDSDDCISLDAIQSLYDDLIQNSSDMSVGKRIEIDPTHNRKIIPRVCDWRLNEVLSGIDVIGMFRPVETWGKLYRRELFENIRFSVAQCGEDLEIYPCLLELCKRVSFVNKVIYYYFIRNDSIMRNRTKTQREDELISTIKMVQATFTHGYFAQAGNWFNRSIELASNIEAGSSEAVRILKNALSYKELKHIWKYVSLRNKVKCFLMYTRCLKLVRYIKNKCVIKN